MAYCPASLYCRIPLQAPVRPPLHATRTRAPHARPTALHSMAERSLAAQLGLLALSGHDPTVFWESHRWWLQAPGWRRLHREMARAMEAVWRNFIHTEGRALSAGEAIPAPHLP